MASVCEGPFNSWDRQVWEWMDDNGCAELTFRDDGAVHVRERVSTERSFSLVRGGA